MVRVQALRVLGDFRTRLPVAPLLKLLHDPDNEVRWVAAVIAGSEGKHSPEVVAALIRMLADPEASLRGAAATGLSYARRKARAALPRLVELTKDQDADVRDRALGALRDIGLPAKQMVPILVRLLSDRHVRREAIEGLGRLGSQAKEAVPALARLLQSKRLSEYERLAVAEALWQIDRRDDLAMPVLLDLLEGGLGEGVCGAICELGPAAAEAAPYLVELIESCPGDMDVQGIASEALCAIGPAVAEELIPYLIDLLHKRDTAAYVAPVLGQLPAAVPALVKALRDRNPVCREWAADALGCLGDRAQAAVPALVQALRDRTREVRWWAGMALARVDPARAPVAMLAEILREGEYDARRRAADLLRGLGPAAREAEPALRQALEDEDKDVRKQAAAALKRLGTGPAPVRKG